jgi:hypothetical protein
MTILLQRGMAIAELAGRPAPRAGDATNDRGNRPRRLLRRLAGTFRGRDDPFRDGDKFMVRADRTRALHEYPIRYTFGIYPLQQYLIALPGGRLAASHSFAILSAAAEFH